MTDAKREQARARQARRREALRAANLVRVELWLPPEDAEAVRAFAAELPARVTGARETPPE